KPTINKAAIRPLTNGAAWRELRMRIAHLDNERRNADATGHPHVLLINRRTSPESAGNLSQEWEEFPMVHGRTRPGRQVSCGSSRSRRRKPAIVVGVFPELDGIKHRVQPVLGQQLLMRAALNDLSILDDENHVGAAHRGKPMRADDACPPDRQV